jgi:hypothetical protein
MLPENRPIGYRISTTDIKYQVVLNHDWDWATVEQKIWRFTPVETFQDAELTAQSMLSRGTATVAQVGICCAIASVGGVG